MGTAEYTPYTDDDPAIESHAGYERGDRVTVVWDNEDEGYYEGDQGVVCGFDTIPPPDDEEQAAVRAQMGGSVHGRTCIMVTIDGQDEPIEVHPDHMEKDG